MPLRHWWSRSRELPGAPHVRALDVTASEWKQSTADAAAGGGRLLSMWASGEGNAVYAALLSHWGVLILNLRAARDRPGGYPGLEGLFPSASRMQRAIADLCGLRSSDPDQRPWLHHAPEGYEFVRVAGEGVHEIAVGPVHAGAIEPGHFRFSVVGEKVLKLEERLGYVHKDIERRFTELRILEAHRLAARISGDSAVAYSWAYCQALEGLAACTIPARAAGLRVLLLELERIANHLGDLGALANDAGFAFGLSQFSRIKEVLLRALCEAFGQRYLLDAIVPGGTRVDVSAQSARSLDACITSIKRESAELRAIYEDHAGLRDRFTGTGVLAPQLATRLGVLGLVGRASGQALDLRIDLPCAPYDSLKPGKIVRQGGDVAARVEVRFEELAQSCALVQTLLASLPAGSHTASVATPAHGAFGAGLIEGWRGPVFIALEAGHAGAIRRCHPHDPSWQNWPALEHAILGNIVPDFPLINKSFNLTYSGVDL